MTHSLPDGYTARSATTEDAACVAQFVNDQSEHAGRGRPATPETVLRNWDHPRFDPSTDTRLVYAPDGTLIGFARIRDIKDPPLDVFGGFVVHPDHTETAWLWDELFDWMDAEARRVIPKAPPDARIALVSGAQEGDTADLRELERHGFDYSRTFHVMQIDFAPEDMARRPKPRLWPEGIGVRGFVPGEDDEILVKVWCEAFADHYGILKQPFEAELEEWRQLMRNDDFDPGLWFLAYDTEDGSIVGLCICSAGSPGDTERGRIRDVGVRPAWRRRGIGRALLLHAFGELATRGIKIAVLSVDTENKSGAPALYQGVGMRSVRASHTYVKELRPGINLVPQ